jgi:hypothetical protein
MHEAALRQAETPPPRRSYAGEEAKMFGRRWKNQEWVPWYRRKDYKGNLTEAEKRELDTFRLQDNHPATRFEDLPEEVKGYIIALELRVYDFKQDKALDRPIFASIAGAIIIFLTYNGLIFAGSFYYFFGTLLLTVPWYFSRREWKKNADELRIDPTDPPISSDEGIQTEWELTYISERKLAERKMEPTN